MFTFWHVNEKLWMLCHFIVQQFMDQLWYNFIGKFVVILQT